MPTPHPIQVMLITGFLGSGKTTFLNHAVRGLPADIKVAALLNEFADIGVDSALITRRENLDVVEITKGSIFCICAKKDFLLGLAQIANQIAPDILLIEATGVANPLDIKKDLSLGVFNNRFAFAGQICLVDTPNFDAAYHVYNAVETQIATSDIFILNKMDLATPAQKQKAEELIATHRVAPMFIEAVHAGVPIPRVFGDVLKKVNPASVPTGIMQLSSQAIEQTAAELEQHTTGTQAPADRLVAAVYQWKGNSREQMEIFISQLPPTILRVKGFVRIGGKICLVSRVMGEGRIEDAGAASQDIPPPLLDRIAFIGPPEVIGALEHSSVSHLLEKQSRHDPISIMDAMPTVDSVC